MVKSGLKHEKSSKIFARYSFFLIFVPTNKQKNKDKVMANLRFLKKEIDYRLEELVFDCDMTIYFRPDKEKEIFAIMQEGVELRNELYHKANNPTEPKNSSLVRKYYAAFRNDMVEGYGKLFEKLSALHD